MELAGGGSLADVIKRKPGPETAQVVIWMKQMARALMYIHGEKVCHRDIKADNVLLSERGHIMLADFGLAVVANSSAASAAKSKTGTAVYFSPEKADGSDGYDSKADMWAAGCVLVEL
ncbi:kinase-like domain-containing protein, partial [Baffinella frigidus]